MLYCIYDKRTALLTKILHIDNSLNYV